MTTIVFCKGSDQSYKGFYCMGHAGYARRRPFRKVTEPDIVCAAISVLVQCTINSLDDLAGEKMKYDENEKTGFIKCDFLEPLQEKSVFLMDSLVYSLNLIVEKYGEKYLQVRIEEV